MSTIVVSDAASIGTITFNQPDTRNALTTEMMSEVSAALAAWEPRPEIRAVILTGAGSTFCAGADLKTLGRLLDNTTEENRRDSERMAGFFRAVYLYPKPVLAAVNGPAYGGGCGVISACDLAVAADTATLSYSEVRLGFVPAIVMTFLLRSVGEKRSKELLLTGRLIDAQTALNFGLYNAVVPADQLLEKTLELAREVIANSPTALAVTKTLMAHIQGHTLDEALAMAVERNAFVRTTRDFREGITAFLEKRKPKWKD
ncbi:MAG: enoyl-CoA hydratase/isomerase family protein [Acidobacteriota bacterium]